MSPPQYECVRVYYPRGLQTGGPEALHQLVDSLRGMGVDAALMPLPGTEDRDRVPGYESYDAPEASMPHVSSTCGVVVPEVWHKALKLEYENLLCWWLSVDNSAFFAASRSWRFRQELSDSRHVLLTAYAREKARRTAYAKHIRQARHLAQSVYAQQQLSINLKIPSDMLSDYTTFAAIDRELSASSRPVIAFNPAKGGHLAHQVRDQFSGTVEWVSLNSMDRTQLQSALLRTDIYLELGHQPGKDRLPREAAACGAVVLALQRGSGAVPSDVAIPTQHKISDEGDIPKKAVALIRRVLADLVAHHALQADYRKKVASERTTFNREVAEVFRGPHAHNHGDEPHQ